LELAQLSLAFWHQMPSSAKMEREKLFVKHEDPSEQLPTWFYDRVFHTGVFAEELLLPYLVYYYLYDEFGVGYRGQNESKGKKYQVLSHGDLTILALAGNMLRTAYRLSISESDMRTRNLVQAMLVPRFQESPTDHPEFFGPFDTQVERLIKVLIKFIDRERARRKREGDSTDIRDILVSPKTYEWVLRDQPTRFVLQKARGKLPTLGK